MERDAMDFVKEAEEAKDMCETCGETCDPAYARYDYITYGVVFCSEHCMREFEEIGK